MSTLKIINSPLFNNINFNITFTLNNNIVNLINKNYTLDELLVAFSPFQYDTLTKKIYTNNIINLRFYNTKDRNYIMTLLGFNNFLDLSNSNDLVISISGYAKYALIINFNEIVKVNVSGKVLNINQVFETPIETGAFSYSNIILLELLYTFENIVVKFLNVYSNIEIIPNNNVVIMYNNNTYYKCNNGV